MPAVSAHDNAVLELPLKVVAPLFLARQTEASKRQKKVVVDDEIPDLFFGFPRQASGSAGVAPVASPVAQVRRHELLCLGRQLRPGPDSGRRCEAWSFARDQVRREVRHAQRSRLARGGAGRVAGALIALPDGLKGGRVVFLRTSMATRWPRFCPKSSAKSANAPKSCGWVKWTIELHGGQHSLEDLSGKRNLLRRVRPTARAARRGRS